MNNARTYLERGLKNCSDVELMDLWITAFERWFEQRSPQTGRHMDDAAAEIRLRGLDMLGSDPRSIN
jgi:hypothetical protein